MTNQELLARVGQVIEEDIKIVPADGNFKLSFCSDNLKALNISFNDEQQIYSFLNGMLYAAVIRQIKDRTEAAERQAEANRKAARRERTQDFNPWKFCGDGKDGHMVFMGCHLHNGRLEATDTHVVIVIDKWQYDERYEGKIVNIDMEEIAGRYPDVERVMPQLNDGKYEVCGSVFNEVELKHDWAWLAAFAKQAKKSEKSEKIDEYFKLGDVLLYHAAVEKIALFLKKFGDVRVFANHEMQRVFFVADGARLFVCGAGIDETAIKNDLVRVIE